MILDIGPDNRSKLSLLAHFLEVLGFPAARARVGRRDVRMSCASNYPGALVVDALGQVRK